jgi:predicted secreted hydrolase
MLKYAIGLALILIVGVAGLSLIDTSGGETVAASAALNGGSTDLSAFSRADAPYAWEFPRDFGSHDRFQTEWWYYTGNLTDESGRRFGYQYTVFRRAIAPTDDDNSGSEWRTNQVYMAHFTVSDISQQRFFHEQRFSRGSADLAYALPNDSQPNEPYQVVLEDWQILMGDAPEITHIRADSPRGFAIDFTLTAQKPPALQGENGLSAKSPEPGNASYYYSLSRQTTEGTLTLGDQTFTVDGLSWMDHEFSTSALGTNALGWDWFGLHFDDGRDLMIGQIRLSDGGKEPAFGGLLIEADGTTRYLPADSFSITPTDTWTSPHTGAEYPAGWTITISGADGFTFSAQPLQPDQELYDSEPSYWEGAVILSGDVTGSGYAELTGYTQPMTNRF